MQKRSSRKHPRDIYQLAASTVEAATSEELQEPQNIPEESPKNSEGKNPAAVALGRLGGLKGGKARASKLTPEQRKEIALKAARARWNNR
jgi:hypothetical protein